MKIAIGNARCRRICSRANARLRIALGFGGLLAAGLNFSAPVLFAGEPIFQQSYPLTPGGSFLLENVNGSVQVEGWDRNEVEVRAMKLTTRNQADADGVKIDVENDPGQVAV